MKNIVGIRFKRLGKIYFFNPKSIKLQKGDKVVVETSQGEELAEVLISNRLVEDDKIIEPLKKVVRIATEKDEKMRAENKAKEKDALKKCQEKIEKHNLPMNLIDTEFKYDGSKVIFYFTADGRIDFRELVKDLASVFRTRIELRQIGVRDEVKRCGGNGICGRELCCCSFLGNFETVSIKMAKEQNISLNPSKISGNCGRLMCCLKYEQEVYEEKLKILPKIGAIVKTNEGTGEVTAVETLKEVIRVKYKDGDDIYYKKHDAKDVVVIKDAIVDNDNLEVDSAEDLEELKKLEKLEKDDKKNTVQEDI